MTNDPPPPPPVEPSDAQNRPSARTRKRPADRVDPAAVDRAAPADNAAPANNTTPVKNVGTARKQSVALVLRPDKPPVDQLDFDDRHDTRATETEEMGERYARLRKDRRRSEWHQLAMRLIVFVVGVAVYLAAFVLLSRLLPDLNPWQVNQIVGLAYIAAGGGVAARSAGRALKQRYGRRGRQDSDST